MQSTIRNTSTMGNVEVLTDKIKSAEYNYKQRIDCLNNKSVQTKIGFCKLRSKVLTTF